MQGVLVLGAPVDGHQRAANGRGIVRCGGSSRGYGFDLRTWCGTGRAGGGVLRDGPGGCGIGMQGDVLIFGGSGWCGARRRSCG